MRRPLEELEVGAQLPDSKWPPVCAALADGIAEMIRSGHWPVTETPRRPTKPRLVVELGGETDGKATDG